MSGYLARVVARAGLADAAARADGLDQPLPPPAADPFTARGVAPASEEQFAQGADPESSPPEALLPARGPRQLVVAAEPPPAAVGSPLAPAPEIGLPAPAFETRVLRPAVEDDRAADMGYAHGPASRRDAAPPAAAPPPLGETIRVRTERVVKQTAPTAAPSIEARADIVPGPTLAADAPDTAVSDPGPSMSASEPAAPPPVASVPSEQVSAAAPSGPEAAPPGIAPRELSEPAPPQTVAAAQRPRVSIGRLVVEVRQDARPVPTAQPAPASAPRPAPRGRPAPARLLDRRPLPGAHGLAQR